MKRARGGSIPGASVWHVEHLSTLSRVQSATTSVIFLTASVRNGHARVRVTCANALVASICYNAQ